MGKSRIEDFWYKNILKNILQLSKLGRTSMKTADSGLNFDHMYRNRAKGVSAFGVFVDRILLNLPSVKVTRNRKEIIIKILRNEILNNLVLKRKTKILDIASGPARYLVELISQFDQNEIEVLCIDKDKRSLNFGKVLAGKTPMRYAKADIFKTHHLKRLGKKIQWAPNIILCSGLFEYKEDDFVEAILKDVNVNIERGGLFIFISLATNPTRKLMSRLGCTAEGKAWDLIYRNPERFREWIINLGFRDVIISLDRWGMYEFCTCRKVC
jgi:SAM-dependent methyltransferase